MRFPHNISRNMFNEYLPSDAALNLLGEQGRTIKSEDEVWENLHPARLSEICLRVIISNFERNPILNKLPCMERNLLLELLPTNLPLPIVLQRIQDGVYWKRMVRDRWRDGVNHVEDYGFSWKRMYMEKHVQELVEGLTPEGFDIDTVNEVCELASNYVYKLNIRQLKMAQPLLESEEEFSFVPECFDHIDLSPVIKGLKNLTELRIQFGLRHIGSNYKKKFFQLSNEDCINIGKGVSEAKSLKVLKIHQSLMDDDNVIALLSNMTRNESLTTLEFSNCLLGDDGAVAVAKYLKGRSNILNLNLCSNKIRQSGVEALAFVLAQKDSSPLASLNLRLNAFGDDGLRFLASALIRENSKIENLNLSCCDLREESGIFLAEVLKRNSVMRELNLSSNHLGERAGKAIESAMERNQTMMHLDLRMTGIPTENMMHISRFLLYNRIRAKRGEKGIRKEMIFLEGTQTRGAEKEDLEERDIKNDKVSQAP